jgi:hypothetical protein
MERWWHVETEKAEIFEDLSQCCCVHYKLHKNWPGIQHEFHSERRATDRLRNGTDFEDKISVNYIQIYSPYRAVNTPSLL